MWCAMYDVRCGGRKSDYKCFWHEKFSSSIWLLQLPEWKVDEYVAGARCLKPRYIFVAKCQATKRIRININIIELNCWKFHQIFHFRSGSLFPLASLLPLSSEIYFVFTHFAIFSKQFYWLNHLFSMVKDMNGIFCCCFLSFFVQLKINCIHL